MYATRYEEGFCLNKKRPHYKRVKYSELLVLGNDQPINVFCKYDWCPVIVFRIACVSYVFCREIATTTNMDCIVGNASRLKPMDARQQAVLASTTNVLEAVLRKHSPTRNRSAPLRCCSSSPNSTAPSIPETIVSTMPYRCCSSKPRSPPPPKAGNGCRWAACTIVNPLPTTICIDRDLQQSIVDNNIY